LRHTHANTMLTHAHTQCHSLTYTHSLSHSVGNLTAQLILLYCCCCFFFYFVCFGWRKSINFYLHFPLQFCIIFIKFSIRILILTNSLTFIVYFAIILNKFQQKFNKYKDWFAFSCDLDNVPTDQPSAPKVDTNQLTKKKLAHAQPVWPRASAIGMYQQTATALKRANFLPQNQFGAQVELRMCLCKCVCVRERQREWESSQLRAIPWPERVNGNRQHHHQHLQATVVGLFSSCWLKLKPKALPITSHCKSSWLLQELWSFIRTVYFASFYCICVSFLVKVSFGFI